MEVAPVLDTDVVIDSLRGAGPGRDYVRAVRESLAFSLTAITAFELSAGAEYARDPSDVDALLAARCLTLTREAAVRGGALLHELRAEGMGIDIRDAMQAGICLEAGAPLVTRNVRHFQRVPGLDVRDPAAA